MEDMQASGNQFSMGGRHEAARRQHRRGCGGPAERRGAPACRPADAARDRRCGPPCQEVAGSGAVGLDILTLPDDTDGRPRRYTSRSLGHLAAHAVRLLSRLAAADGGAPASGRLPAPGLGAVPPGCRRRGTPAAPRRPACGRDGGAYRERAAAPQHSRGRQERAGAAATAAQYARDAVLGVAAAATCRRRRSGVATAGPTGALPAGAVQSPAAHLAILAIAQHTGPTSRG